MAQNCRVTLTFETVSLLPEDQIVNTFLFRWIGPGEPSNFTHLANMLKDFVNTQPSGATSSIGAMLGNTVFTSWYWIRVYNLDHPKPRSPIFEERTSFTRGTGDSLPREVACVMSFQAQQVSGTPQRRRRNRIYLGPFLEARNTSTGRPDPTLRSNISRAARDLIDASTGASPWQWNIWSSFFPEDNVPVLDGWVDDTWDTQRRRGPRQTERTTFTRTTPA